MAENCNPCNNAPAPCTDCTQVLQQINYCDDGCKDITFTDCIKFSADNITLPGGIIIENNEELTSIIRKLANNSLDVSLSATFSQVSRILTLTKNGAIYASVTIPDQDNQFLGIDGTKLQIFTNTAGGAVKINEVDLAPLFVETVFSASSSSLSIAPGGVKGHSPSIELIPSGDNGNKLIIGSDGRPFVPVDAIGIKDVIILPVEGLSYTKSIQNGVITFIPVLDYEYIASRVCALCSPSCGQPSDLNVQSI